VGQDSNLDEKSAGQDWNLDPQPAGLHPFFIPAKKPGTPWMIRQTHVTL
jgi:hypothetical protein